MLHELIGVERERVTDLMAQLQLSAAELEKQREAAASAGNALRIAMETDLRDGMLESMGVVEEGDEEGEALGIPAGSPGGTGGQGWQEVQDRGGSDVAKIIKRYGVVSNAAKGRPVSAHAGKSSGSGSSSGSSAPTAFGTSARRRPTSAAGMGIRAYINGSLKSYREV